MRLHLMISARGLILIAVGSGTRCSIEASVRQDGLVWIPGKCTSVQFPQRIYVMLLESSQGNPTELRIIVINFSLNPL